MRVQGRIGLNFEEFREAMDHLFGRDEKELSEDDRELRERITDFMKKFDRQSVLKSIQEGIGKNKRKSILTQDLPDF